jgi:propionyl-CoA carboxylase alpha chain
MFISFNGLSRLFEVYTPKEWAMMKYMPEKADQGAQQHPGLPDARPGGGCAGPEGRTRFRGQNLVILESMKMESGVASPVDGVIAEVLVNKGPGGGGRTNTDQIRGGVGLVSSSIYG